MVNDGEAIMIDVRTLEECLWVGMPNVAVGGLYIIPWLTKTISTDGTVVTELNPDFAALVSQEFGDNPDQALIMMCRSGGRSTATANLLESIGFTKAYEVNNVLKEFKNGTGGCGGFQRTALGSDYYGYRGYSAGLPHNRSPKRVTVQTSTDRI